jgi:hypothetical protein
VSQDRYIGLDLRMPFGASTEGGSHDEGQG